ncbi:hypothetical protein ACIRG5_07120 [Lentzea sp. NPDC102401]|uniref:hypothetical protein n=1 Tax=Lentzea sp. NPDC102401 TaxID=3364128 RepID=UPI0038188801
MSTDSAGRILDAVLTLSSRHGISGVSMRAVAREARLIRAARPELSRYECAKRAAGVGAIQNGAWLTALLGLDLALWRPAVPLRSDRPAMAGPLAWSPTCPNSMIEA